MLSTDNQPQQFPRFPIGTLVWTPGVNQLIEEGQIDPLLYVCRHVDCDWGDLDQEDIDTNVLALEYGNRIFSSYEISSALKIWIITEADRSVTTILLPHEY